MEVMIFVMFAAVLAVIALVVLILLRSKRTRERMHIEADKYDVFAFTGSQLIVLAGSPAAYEIDEIERVTFTAMKAPRSMSAYNGVLRIVKKNGKKSRPFLFYGSAYTKKATLSSSKQEIEQAMAYLMAQLREHRIPCARV